MTCAISTTPYKIIPASLYHSRLHHEPCLLSLMFLCPHLPTVFVLEKSFSYMLACVLLCQDMLWGNSLCEKSFQQKWEDDIPPLVVSDPWGSLTPVGHWQGLVKLYCWTGKTPESAEAPMDALYPQCLQLSSSEIIFLITMSEVHPIPSLCSMTSWCNYWIDPCLWLYFLSRL